MKSNWLTSARAELRRRCDRLGVWGYRADSQPSVEATVIACLGLWSLREANAPGADSEAISRASDWLSSMQGRDGSLGVSPSISAPGWPTAQALWLWSLLGTQRESRRRAALWLLAEQGQPLVEESGPSPIFGHDSSLIGWPWIDGTHSWLEPTAAAIIALSAAGFGGEARVAEGARLLIDRALPHGGWNYGNKSVFGRELRPQPGPSGLALLALSRFSDGKRPSVVERGIDYLRTALPGVRAPVSLGWGVLGLKAWDERPEQAGDWLAASFSEHASDPDATVGLGLLLAAAGLDSLTCPPART